MKNKLILILSLFLVSSLKQSAQTFEKSDIDLNAGIGLGYNLYPGNNFEIGIPPLALSVDYGFDDAYGPGVIGLGGIIGFSSFKEETITGGIPDGYKYAALFLGARGTYHIELDENLDVYGGLMLYFVSIDYNPFGTPDEDRRLKNRPGLSLIAGGKYYFSEQMAFFAEVGYSVAWLTAGVTFKL